MMNFRKTLITSFVLGICCSVSLYSGPTAENNTVARNSSPKTALPKDTVAFNKVKNMYIEFVKLIETGVSDTEMIRFFNTYFDVDEITKKFTGSKNADANLTQSLVNYFKFLLNGQIIKQVKDYNLSEEFSQITKKNSIIILCKLHHKDSKVASAALDMSVSLAASSSKVLELSFMKSIYLIKGAKNIVDLYCQEKTINYKGLRPNSRVKICIDALDSYVKKQSATVPLK